MIRYLISIVLSIALAAVATGQSRYTEYPRQQADAAAAAALATFRLLVDERNFEEMGFSSPDEPARATLGTPIQEWMVRLDRLRQYQGGVIQELLTATGRVTYPVLVGGEPRSSLAVGNRDGDWEAVSFGAPNYARALTEVASSLGGEGLFEVRVPALNVSFVGARQGGEVTLTPIVDDPRFGFERGETMPAERALSALVEAAREHNGLPT